ncbi:RsfA family transcriptional regulator [Peribacillus sp. NJ4]|uniref:RsfA family transcriptional regulator n=1 Tax=Peribacillus TaxID=2675229 RepID=UPI0025A289F3|nr:MULTISPECIES: RsfA family transcriptional regulator [unclassified Peribacillus]MDM5213489.1 RsfA family transcriptional regulator [Peribacillus sp. NJ4]MDM5223862.1 RsfA family transcriptional regulator [Peribacillus sp. NJ11]
MSIARQDAWTHDEDLLLAEVVLRHIREGSTQLKAFEEVGKQLSRTSAACGFRWNSFVRKQYKSGIELAKKQRKEQVVIDPDVERDSSAVVENNTIEQKTPQQEENESITLQEVILYLTKMDEFFQLDNKEKERISERSLFLERENVRLKEENALLKENLKAVEEDYRALMQIMERARKLSVQEDEKMNPKVSFQMDKNGNLERVNK